MNIKPLTEGEIPEQNGIENEEIKDLLNRLGGMANSINAWHGLSKVKGNITVQINLKVAVGWQKTIHEAIKVIEGEWL